MGGVEPDVDAEEPGPWHQSAGGSCQHGHSKSPGNPVPKLREENAEEQSS